MQREITSMRWQLIIIIIGAHSLMCGLWCNPWARSPWQPLGVDLYHHLEKMLHTLKCHNDKNIHRITEKNTATHHFWYGCRIWEWTFDHSHVHQLHVYTHPHCTTSEREREREREREMRRRRKSLLNTIFTKLKKHFSHLVRTQERGQPRPYDSARVDPKICIKISQPLLQIVWSMNYCLY